ncbi:hypothetical protein USB125703_01356 [Pseudoclavibacter triregionum]|nr:hypothetical protein USB125703_01356 [Pseudoclavibacter triregionum]
MVKPLEQNMGADALWAATGRDHEAWRELLDAAGARDWTHAATARYLVEQHGVSGWWAQGITVDYEQARKGRLPGQQADGTFAVSLTRTIAGERLEALAAVERVVAVAHGEPHGRNLGASMPVVRWRLDDGRRLAAAAQPPNKSGTPVNLTMEQLPTAESVEPVKAELLALLAAAQVERAG